MARITVERAHLVRTARAKAEKLANKLKEQYGLEPSWSGDTLNLKRSGLKALCWLRMIRCVLMWNWDC